MPAVKPSASTQFNVKAPPAPVPLLVNGTNGGFNASTNAGPGSAPDGNLKRNRVELTVVSGILGVPSGFKPPRFTTPRAVILKKLGLLQIEWKLFGFF